MVTPTRGKVLLPMGLATHRVPHMADPAAATPGAPETPVPWFAWKRYLLIAISLLILYFIAPGISGESDSLSHIMDDIVISAMAILTIVLIVAYWRAYPLRSHRVGRASVQGVFVIALLAQIVGVAIEYSDPNDVGNEYFGFVLITLGLAIALV